MNRIRENMKDGEDRQKQENTNYEKSSILKKKTSMKWKTWNFIFKGYSDHKKLSPPRYIIIQ